MNYGQDKGVMSIGIIAMTLNFYELCARLGSNVYRYNCNSMKLVKIMGKTRGYCQ